MIFPDSLCKNRQRTDQDTVDQQRFLDEFNLKYLVADALCKVVKFQLTKAEKMVLFEKHVKVIMIYCTSVESEAAFTSATM